MEEPGIELCRGAKDVCIYFGFSIVGDLTFGIKCLPARDTNSDATAWTEDGRSKFIVELCFIQPAVVESACVLNAKLALLSRLPEPTVGCKADDEAIIMHRGV